MDKLVDHVWVLGEDGQTTVRDYPGNYSQYRAIRAEEMQRRQAARREGNRGGRFQITGDQRRLLKKAQLQGAP